jgi:hypothetical protein
VRFFVKEPAVWVENRRLQRTQHREVRVPLFSIFKRAMLGNTLTACWWMASAFVVGYSILALFPTYLQTAGGFVYHQGAIFGGLVGPVLAYLATSWNIGFAIPMLIGTTVGCVSLIMAILFSPETRGKVLVADLQVA